jgi:hypothetical protein
MGHTKLEAKERKKIDYSVPAVQGEYKKSDELCKMMGSEYEWRMRVFLNHFDCSGSNFTIARG